MGIVKKTEALRVYYHNICHKDQWRVSWL